MTEVAKALASFYGGFRIPAYEEYSVPDDAELPYITYTVPQGDAFQSATHQARVWYATDKGAPSNVQVNAKADEILAAIGRGVRLPAGQGYVIISNTRASSSFKPAAESTTKTATSAECMIDSARSMPMLSIASPLSRTPAVS